MKKRRLPGKPSPWPGSWTLIPDNMIKEQGDQVEKCKAREPHFGSW
jgi:hypothetical protein